MLRTTKTRSNENAIFQPNYNRMRFVVNADDMSTDMSQSYLAFKLYIVNGLTGKSYTKEEIAKLDKSSIAFSFGDSLGEAYSAACLIKVARLFTNDGRLLEEINYSNVLSQTLFQLRNNFETLASESLLNMSSTGMLLNGSISAGTSSFFANDTDANFNQSIQVNIKLKDIFGLGQSENMWLSMIGGMIVELELEDTKPLITQSCVTNLIDALPGFVKISTDPAPPVFTKGYTHDYSTNPYSTRCLEQNLYAPSSNAIASLYNNTTVAKISCPQSFRYDSSYISVFFPGAAAIGTNALVKDAYYRITDLGTGTLTAANWQTAGTLPKAPETPVMPALGDVFKCKAQTIAGGQCIAVTANNQIVGVAGGNSKTISISSSSKWTQANMESLQIEAGTLIKLVFKISQANHVERLFEFMSLVNNVTPFADPSTLATIVLKDNFVYPIFQGTPLQGATIVLDSFEVIPNSEQFQFQITSFETLVESNVIREVPAAEVLKLQIAGILSGGTLAQVTDNKIKHLTGGNVFFNAAISIINTVSEGSANVVCVYPDEYTSPDLPSQRRLYSNQSKKMPTQTGLLKITKATKNANNTTWDLFFETMGLENDNSLQGRNLICPGIQANLTGVLPGLGVKTQGSGFYLNVFNSKIPNLQLPAQDMVVGEWYGITAVGTDTDAGTILADWVAAGNDTGLTPEIGQSFRCIAPISEAAVGAKVLWLQSNRSDHAYVAKSWRIEKAELVLVQSEKDPSMVPSPIYSTYKVEAATIENSNLTEYNRQFIVLEPNCYNVLLLTPHYTSENLETLISKARGISQYRWSLNNIDNTNRNIVVRDNTSSFPSTLHLDKLADCMRNNVGELKSLSGINGVTRSVDPPVVFPLKIYTAGDAYNNYLNPMSGYTLQFAGYSDPAHRQYITSGVVMLFKQCFRTL